MKRIGIVLITLGVVSGMAVAGTKKETGMVVEYIRYELSDSQIQPFIAAYTAAGKDLEASPNCLSYEITRGVEKPNQFTVRIEWDSVNGHMEGFRKSPEFRSFFAKVKPFFDSIREMNHYDVIATKKK